MANMSQVQRQASNPARSIWLAANAGTGKTTVLVARLLRLMINPATPPNTIVALTFTKAAATEMQERLHARLHTWQHNAEKCTEELSELLEHPPTATELSHAQNLLKVVENQPPFIGTIHSFCQRLLTRFPLEAGLQPAFTVLEQPQAERLLTAAQQQVFTAMADPAHPHHAAYRTFVTMTGEEGMAHLLASLTARRGRVQPLLENLPHILTQLASALELVTPPTAASYAAHLATFVPTPQVQTTLRSALSVWQSLGGNAVKIADKLAAYLACLPAMQALNAAA
ncbi:MAG: UvrD-helicase domain-containing protein, partial [Alphaproteobacteria bacterium]